MGQGKMICPGCGAELSEKDIPFCPYCGRKLIDLSRERTDVLLGLLILLRVTDRIREAKGQADVDRLSSAMKRAYEKEDWEQLEEYLIYECEEYIGAPDYFCYRTAWFLHTYPPLFDEAYRAHDTDEMYKLRF